uniref:Uncharacterized protein n=1 Tax=Oryza nivara TaxID=4536 RepID=A0A0E0HSV5_ORYNI
MWVYPFFLLPLYLPYLSLSLFGDRGAEWRLGNQRHRGSCRSSRPRGDAMSASPPTGAAAAATRLHGHGGIRCTIAVTRFIVGSTKTCSCLSLVHVAVFFGSCDEGGLAEFGGHCGPYFERLEEVGSMALDELLREEVERGRLATVVVYDTFIPWMPRLAWRS